MMVRAKMMPGKESMTSISRIVTPSRRRYHPAMSPSVMPATAPSATAETEMVSEMRAP